MLLYIQYPQWLRSEIIPGLPIRWYGLMYLVAFTVTYLLFMYQVKREKLKVDREQVMNLFFWGIIGLLVGARLFATILFSGTDYYLRKPWLIFWPFHEGRFVGLQGMNYYGGLVGAIVALVIYGRVKKLNMREWGDMLLAGVPLGYTFGRLGNFINGELFGRVTTLPWGVVFPHAEQFPASEQWVRDTAARAGMEIAESAAMVNLPRHPTQLYEAFAEGIVMWLILWFVFRKHKLFRGFVIGMYVVLYGVFRFIIDYFRMPIVDDFAITLSKIDNPPYLLLTPWNFLPSQIYSFLMIVGGVVTLLVFRWADRRPAGEAHGRAGSQEGRAHKVNMRKLRRRLK